MRHGHVRKRSSCQASKAWYRLLHIDERLRGIWQIWCKSPVPHHGEHGEHEDDAHAETTTAEELHQEEEGMSLSMWLYRREGDINTQRPFASLVADPPASLNDNAGGG